MRKWRIIAVVIMIAVPWIGTLLWMQVTGEAVSQEVSWTEEAEEAAGNAEEAAGNAEETGSAGISGTGAGKRILMERNNIRTYMDIEDYLPGVMVCQMPDRIDGREYSLETWKCQAVIARTYICRLMEGRDEIYEEELDMDYLGETRGLWGEQKEDAFRRLEAARQAAEETCGVVMKYEDRCILPLFHEISAGRTRQGHEDFPYITSVDSSRDAQRESYLCVMEWPKAEFASRISQIPDAAAVTADQLPGEIQTVEKDDAGYITQMKIGTRIYTGDEVRYALGMPSACFSLEGDGGTIRARIKGRGHGYGLSQAGADSMAADGWGYQEILQHYYKNISLISE